MMEGRRHPFIEPNRLKPYIRNNKGKTIFICPRIPASDCKGLFS
jgi:hypothetical protein